MWLGQSARHRRWVFLASAVLLMPASCVQHDGTAGSASPAPRKVAAEMRRTGGLCPSGPCSSQLTVYEDGHWTGHREKTERSGDLSAADRERLADALSRTMLGPSLPASGGGPCADAADGTVTTYSLRHAGKSVSLSSCDHEIPPSDPLVTTMEKWHQELLPAR